MHYQPQPLKCYTCYVTLERQLPRKCTVAWQHELMDRSNRAGCGNNVVAVEGSTHNSTSTTSPPPTCRMLHWPKVGGWVSAQGKEIILLSGPAPLIKLCRIAFNVNYLGYRAVASLRYHHSYILSVFLLPAWLHFVDVTAAFDGSKCKL